MFVTKMLSIHWFYGADLFERFSTGNDPDALSRAEAGALEALDAGGNSGGN